MTRDWLLECLLTNGHCNVFCIGGYNRLIVLTKHKYEVYNMTNELVAEYPLTCSHFYSMCDELGVSE